jgi:hypothetical protein
VWPDDPRLHSRSLQSSGVVVWQRSSIERKLRKQERSGRSGFLTSRQSELRGYPQSGGIYRRQRPKAYRGRDDSYWNWTNSYDRSVSRRIGRCRGFGPPHCKTLSTVSNRNNCGVRQPYARMGFYLIKPSRIPHRTRARKIPFCNTRSGSQPYWVSTVVR